MEELTKEQEDFVLEEAREASADARRKNEDGATKFED